MTKVRISKQQREEVLLFLEETSRFNFPRDYLKDEDLLMSIRNTFYFSSWKMGKEFAKFKKEIRNAIFKKHN